MKDFEFKPAADLNLSYQERQASVAREPTLIENAGNRLWRIFLRLYAALFHRLKVQGRENLPTHRPFILVANHCSHLDALVLTIALPARHSGRVYPLAAGDVFFEKPGVMSFATMFINALPVGRGKPHRHAIKTLRDRLSGEQCIYILFPEGRRSPDGAMLPFMPGIGMLIAGTDTPILPCRITGAFEAWPRHRRCPRPGRVSVTIGKPLHFAQTPNQRPGWEAVAQQLEQAVKALD